MLKKTIVISGFPGVGKSTLLGKTNDLTILDSDSTDFSWSSKKEGIRHPEWPNNYVKHIKDNIGVADMICVSSHDVVRSALAKESIHFCLIYPGKEMKSEYIQRYKNRGSDERFVKLLEDNYETWIDELMLQSGCKHVVLSAGQYLSDVVENIYD